MARKKKHEEHENHERWLVSYADFITLLFAFFVVMYALSSVNEGKYRVLSDALISAFHTPPKSIDPIQVGEALKPPKDMIQDVVQAPNNFKPIQMPRKQTDASASGTKDHEEPNKLNKIANKLEVALNKMIERDLIKVHKNDNWIEVEINTSILFGSGSALLQPQAIPVLTEIARILKDFPNAIRVEGYTDNIPIETQTFPSNWELSAGRAASVVHLFSDERVDPFRMSAIGYGEYRPVAANTTPEGRNANRRVVVLILSEAAEKLFDRGTVTTIRGGDQPVKDVNLDAPLPVIKETHPGTNDKPIPEGFPTGLPLLNRAPVPASNASKAQMNLLLEDIAAPPSGSTVPAAPKRGGQ